MIAGLPSLSGLLRRSRGRPGIDEPEAGADKTLKSGENLLRRKRIKVAIFAILFGLVSAAIDLPLPAEDTLRLARTQLRMRPAPQDIVMITIDDATLNQLRAALPTRKEDAEVIDRLVEAGVNKIVFDNAHADPGTPEADAAFAKALERHPGKVWLGMAPEFDLGFQTNAAILPYEPFRERAGMASMFGQLTPFGLSARFPAEVEWDGETYPSISSVLAGYDGALVSYRPDFAFNPGSVPTYRYVDIPRCYAGEPYTGTFFTPYRTVTIPHARGRAGKLFACSHDRNLRCENKVKDQSQTARLLGAWIGKQGRCASASEQSHGFEKAKL